MTASNTAVSYPSSTSSSSSQMQEPYWTDHQVISALWQHVEHIIAGCAWFGAAQIRHLASLLPPLHRVPTPQLPALASLHLESAKQLQHTMKLLIPQAFSSNSTSDGGSDSGSGGGSGSDSGSDSDNGSGSDTHMSTSSSGGSSSSGSISMCVPNMQALMALDEASTHLLSALIELQLFHLLRARDVTATMRMRIEQRCTAVQPRQAQQHYDRMQQQQHLHDEMRQHEVTSSSDDAGDSSECEWAMSLE